jgi:hypothetical protein
VMGGRRELHNEELRNLLSSPNIITVESRKMGRTGSTHGGGEECMLDFGGKARRNETTRKAQT